MDIEIYSGDSLHSSLTLEQDQFFSVAYNGLGPILEDQSEAYQAAGETVHKVYGNNVENADYNSGNVKVLFEMDGPVEVVTEYTAAKHIENAVTGQLDISGLLDPGMTSYVLDFEFAPDVADEYVAAIEHFKTLDPNSEEAGYLALGIMMGAIEEPNALVAHANLSWEVKAPEGEKVVAGFYEF